MIGSFFWAERACFWSLFNSEMSAEIIITAHAFDVIDIVFSHSPVHFSSNENKP